MRGRDARGGVLLDLFIIAVILAAGAAGVVAWKMGALSGFLKRLPEIPWIRSRPAAEPPAAVDVSDRSTWIQGRARDLLVRQGLVEGNVIKTYNVERREDGIQWLEDTLEVRRPPKFNEASFLRHLAPILADRKLVVMEDRREEGRWTLAIGDRKRVFQRMIFESSR